MNVTKVNINKVSTFNSFELSFSNGIEKQSYHKVFTMKSKKAAFDFINSLDSVSGVISVNAKSAIKKLEAMGFDVDADFSYGLYDDECSFIAIR